jgi:hypothetical protein
LSSIGAAFLVLASLLVAGWVLNLIRHGRLYVGYGIVVLVLVGAIAGMAVVPPFQSLSLAFIEALYPREPVAVIGLGAVLLLLIYVLHQLSVLSERVATLTQELAIRASKNVDRDGD